MTENAEPLCEHGYTGRHDYPEDMEDQVAWRVCEGPRRKPLTEPRDEAAKLTDRVLDAWDLMAEYGKARLGEFDWPRLVPELTAAVRAERARADAAEARLRDVEAVVNDCPEDCTEQAGQ